MQLPKPTKHLLVSTLAAALLAVSPAASMAQALPPTIGCPEGWVQVESPVDHRIRCVPGRFAAQPSGELGGFGNDVLIGGQTTYDASGMQVALGDGSVRNLSPGVSR